MTTKIKINEAAEASGAELIKKTLEGFGVKNITVGRWEKSGKRKTSGGLFVSFEGKIESVKKFDAFLKENSCFEYIKEIVEVEKNCL